MPAVADLHRRRNLAGAGWRSARCATAGSFENVRLIREELADIGLVQSDIAAAAAKGSGAFATDGAMGELRALGSLFPEAVQIVVAPGFADRRRSPT